MGRSDRERTPHQGQIFNLQVPQSVKSIANGPETALLRWYKQVEVVLVRQEAY